MSLFSLCVKQLVVFSFQGQELETSSSSESEDDFHDPDSHGRVSKSNVSLPWWRTDMDMFFVLLALCEGNPPLSVVSLTVMRSVPTILTEHTAEVMVIWDGIQLMGRHCNGEMWRIDTETNGRGFAVEIPILFSCMKIIAFGFKFHNTPALIRVKTWYQTDQKP